MVLAQHHPAVVAVDHISFLTDFSRFVETAAGTQSRYLCRREHLRPKEATGIGGSAFSSLDVPDPEGARGRRRAQSRCY